MSIMVSIMNTRKLLIDHCFYAEIIQINKYSKTSCAGCTKYKNKNRYALILCN